MTTDAINYNGHRIVDGIPQLDSLRCKGDLDLSFCTALTMLPEGLSVRGWLNLELCTALTERSLISMALL
jgi:hypothetical protein